MAKKTTPPADAEAAEPETETPSTAVAIIEPITEKPSFIELIKFDKKEASIKIIKDKAAEYAKVKIDGVEDKVNYLVVAGNMKQMKDDRIAFENAAYANVIDPLKEALKEYAADIDAVVEEFKTAEQAERDKKKFIDDEKLRIKKEKEEAKARAAQMRITDLMVLGAKFDGQLYTFDYDAGLLINSLQLVDFSDEEYGEFLEEVKTAFAEEQTRLHEEKLRLDEEENERLLEIERNRQLAADLKLKDKALNERVIKIREKEVKLLGLVYDGVAYYTHPTGCSTIVREELENVSDELWEDLLSLVAAEIENYVEPAPEVSIIPDSEIPAFVQEFESAGDDDDDITAFEGRVSPLADDIMDIDLLEEVVLTFDKATSFIDIDISPKTMMRIFPECNQDAAFAGIEAFGSSGRVQGLYWAIISKEMIKKGGK